MAHSINLTDVQKTEVTKLIAESDSTDDTATAWISGHLNTFLEISMRNRLCADINNNWRDLEKEKDAIQALDLADMEIEYAKYFPSE